MFRAHIANSEYVLAPVRRLPPNAKSFKTQLQRKLNGVWMKGLLLASQLDEVAQLLENYRLHAVRVVEQLDQLILFRSAAINRSILTYFRQPLLINRYHAANRISNRA
jgi:hypothetical protein